MCNAVQASFTGDESAQATGARSECLAVNIQRTVPSQPSGDYKIRSNLSVDSIVGQHDTLSRTQGMHTVFGYDVCVSCTTCFETDCACTVIACAAAVFVLLHVCFCYGGASLDWLYILLQA